VLIFFFDIWFSAPLTECFGVQISKAVEAEVARRLAEREREREAERVKEEIEVAHTIDPIQSGSKSPEREQSIPSGVLTPLLKRHRELDDELKNRLQELEQK
jgi:kinesin family protein 22